MMMVIKIFQDICNDIGFSMRYFHAVTTISQV